MVGGWRWLQVLDFLQGQKMDILVAGDSMMRQLYIRMVHMMRGARRVLVHSQPSDWTCCRTCSLHYICVCWRRVSRVLVCRPCACYPQAE